MTMKVATCARTSTNDKGQGTENQLIHLRQFAAYQGWELVRESVDEISGKSADRPEDWRSRSVQKLDLIDSLQGRDFTSK